MHILTAKRFILFEEFLKQNFVKVLTINSFYIIAFMPGQQSNIRGIH